MTDMIIGSSGTMEQLEKQIILLRYKLCRGNAAQTAISLGLSDKTIRTKLEQYEEEGQRERDRYEQEKIDNARILERMRGISPGTKLEASQTSLYRADDGVHMEPRVEARTEPTVPMPEREEVQSVLPGPTPKGRKGSRSQGLSGANGKA